MKRPVTLVLVASLLMSASAFAGKNVSGQIAARMVANDSRNDSRHGNDNRGGGSHGDDHRGGHDRNPPAPPSNGGGHDRRDDHRNDGHHGNDRHDNDRHDNDRHDWNRNDHRDSNHRNDNNRYDHNRYDHNRNDNHSSWNGHSGWDRPRSDWVEGQSAVEVYGQYRGRPGRFHHVRSGGLHARIVAQPGRRCMRAMCMYPVSAPPESREFAEASAGAPCGKMPALR